MHLTMENKVKPLDKSELLKRLTEENNYIQYLLEAFEIPEKKSNDDELKEYLLDTPTTNGKGSAFGLGLKRKPAESAEELQDRLSVMKNKIAMKYLQRKSNKPSESKTERKKLKKEKELKKKFNKIKKDAMKNEKLKQERADAKEHKKIVETAKTEKEKSGLKPIFNVESKIVFSKFEFAESEKKKKGLDTNPRNLLNKIKKQKEELNELKQSGDREKYAAVKNDLAWKKAFDKTFGNKIKDDPQLLIKKIKKRKTEIKKSKQKWQERKQKIEHTQETKQKKRTENIKDRADKKKNKKLKQLAAQGRIIPGF